MLTGCQGQVQHAGERLGRGEQLVAIGPDHDIESEPGVADLGAQHEGALHLTEPAERPNGGLEERVRWCRQDTAYEPATEDAGAVAVGHRHVPFEEDAGVADRGEVAGQVIAAELAQQRRRHVGQPGGDRQQLALGLGGAGEDLLGEVLEQHRVGGQQAVDEGRVVDRPAPAEHFGGELHGERPTAGHAGDLVDGRRLRCVEPADVGGADGQVAGRDAGDLAGGSEAGDAQHRRLAAGEHEVQARRQVQDERLEELVQRIAVAGRRRRR